MSVQPKTGFRKIIFAKGGGKDAVWSGGVAWAASPIYSLPLASGLQGGQLSIGRVSLNLSPEALSGVQALNLGPRLAGPTAAHRLAGIGP